MRRGESVFMLDAHNVVIAGESQGGRDSLPLDLAVAPAYAAKDPGALAHAGIAFGVQHTVLSRSYRVDGNVFGVEVEDGIAKHRDRSWDVDTLPPEMAGVEVDAESRACGFAEMKKSVGVIDTEARMGLDSYLDAGIRGELLSLTPVRDESLVPLPIKALEIFGGPGCGDPVRSFVLGASARAAREGNNDGYFKKLGEPYSLLEGRVVLRCDGCVGMDGVSVTGECADGKAGICQARAIGLRGGWIAEQRHRINVTVAGPATAAKL